MSVATQHLPGVIQTIAPVVDRYGYLAVGGLLLWRTWACRCRARRCWLPQLFSPA